MAWPSSPALPTSCAAARTRATSPLPTWREAVCSTFSPPTTFRPALLHGAYLLHARLAVPLPAAIATVTATPAERAGLDGRGVIEPGYRADLVRVRVIADLPVIQGVWRGGQRVV